MTYKVLEEGHGGALAETQDKPDRNGVCRALWRTNLVEVSGKCRGRGLSAGDAELYSCSATTSHRTRE